MRSYAAILSPLIMAGMLLFTSVGIMLGQDGPQTEASQEDPRPEWAKLAKARMEFDLSDAAFVPSQLTLAIEQANCPYTLTLDTQPNHIIRYQSRHFAIVFCEFAVNGSHQIFDLHNLRRPRLVELPNPENPEGFGTTNRPGVITWKRETGILLAETGSDTSCARIRKTYRLGSYSLSFVIVRVEYARDEACGKDEWITLWDAPQWTPPAGSK